MTLAEFIEALKRMAAEVERPAGDVRIVIEVPRKRSEPVKGEVHRREVWTL